MEKKQSVKEKKSRAHPEAKPTAPATDETEDAVHEVEAAPVEGAAAESVGENPPAERPQLIFPLSYPVPLVRLREALPFLNEHGLCAEVDLADTTYNGEVSIRDLERLAIELRRNRVKVIAHLPHHDLKLASHDKMVLQHSMEAIQEGLEIGKILGARVAIFHSGFSNHVRPDAIDWWVEQSIASLRELVARAQEEEVIVALRNTWESDEQVLARLFEAIDSPWFRFCCDVGHAACFSQFAPEEWIVQFRERIVNLHFHDNDGMQDLHLACGAGVVGFDVMYETIREELSEPVNITLHVNPEDLETSIQHLEECGFKFERTRS
ncbi:MAG: sugar phosphate isomerase/epimerase [Candidatus Eisenbacteria bacterium]